MPQDRTLTPRRTGRYGWRPDLPDARDHVFTAPQIALVALPPSVDLRPGCPPVYDQGQNWQLHGQRHCRGVRV